MNWFLKVLKQYADFNGRARRKEYWMFVLIFMLIYFVLGFLIGLLQMPSLAIIVMIFAIAMIIPSIAVAVRRMHDVGKSGWYCLIPIYSLILAVTEGVKGSNEYGPDPKGNDEVDQIGVSTEN